MIVLKYQTLISGLFGFLGIIVTLLFNGWAQRNQLKKMRCNEKNTFVTALCAELTVNKQVINDLISSFQDEEVIKTGYYHMVPKRDINGVYISNLTKIGILSPDESQCIVSLYLSLEKMKQDLLTVSHWSKARLHDDFIAIPTGAWSLQATKKIKPYINLIDNALNLLK